MEVELEAGEYLAVSVCRNCGRHWMEAPTPAHDCKPDDIERWEKYSAEVAEYRAKHPPTVPALLVGVQIPIRDALPAPDWAGAKERAERASMKVRPKLELRPGWGGSNEEVWGDWAVASHHAWRRCRTLTCPRHWHYTVARA